MRKQWYLSRTIWAGLLTIIVSLFNLNLDPVLQGTMVDVGLEVATGILGAATIYGRVKADEPVASSKNDQVSNV